MLNEKVNIEKLWDILDRSLDKEKQWKHPLTTKLLSLGISVESEHIGKSGSFWGMKCLFPKSELTYRLPDERVVVILKYKRLEPRRSLANPFRDFLWFVELLTDKSLGLKWVMGAPKPLATDLPTMPVEKLSRFYKAFLRGQTLGWRDGVEWLCLDLDTYMNPRICWKLAQMQKHS